MRDRWWPPLRAFALYALLTAVLTWPYVTRLRILDAGDSAFFAWVMAWELHALFTDPAVLPHANMFHPHRFVLGLDEPVLGTTLLALPLRLFTADAVFVFNLTRLLTYAASGLTAYLLARELRCAEVPALVAGALFAFSPIRTDQIAHLSTLGSQWLPLVLLFLFRFARGGRARDALLSAVFYVLTAYACGYHGVLAVAVLPLPAAFLIGARWSRWPKALAAAALAGLGVLPLLLLHRAALAPLQFVRNLEETRYYAAALETLLATSSWNRLWGPLTEEFRTTFANNLFPGLLPYVLPALGLVAVARRGRRPGREALTLALLALVAVVVCLGPDIRFFGRTLARGPFGFLREAVPLFQNIRVTARAGIFLALALSALSGLALTALRLRPAVAAGLGVLGLVETLVIPIPTPSWSDVVDTRKPAPPVYAWLAAQPGEPAVVEVPMLDVEGVINEPAFHESIYLVHSTRHWKPLVNGYAGHEPPDYLQLRQAMRRFPSAESLAELRARGTRYVIVHRWGHGPNRWARIERDLPGFLGRDLREVARFDGDTVYELVTPAASR
jgi:hypothetical protein